jgi:anaerobic ribonucleoside-triphosphate reductase activating protein
MPDLEVEELLQRVGPWLEECDGVTISGGEPFEQSDALEHLLRRIRKTSSTNILVFSGLPLEDIQDRHWVKDGLIDCLISDPFEADASQRMYMRGSDNQRMTSLTPLGVEMFGALDRPACDGDRRLDVMFDEDGVVWLAGIPGRGDMARLGQLLLEQGTYLNTTEARA